MCTGARIYAVKQQALNIGEAYDFTLFRICSTYIRAKRVRLKSPSVRFDQRTIITRQEKIETDQMKKSQPVRPGNGDAKPRM